MLIIRTVSIYAMNDVRIRGYFLKSKWGPRANKVWGTQHRTKDVTAHKHQSKQIISLIQKVKWSRYRPGVAQKVGRGIALLFHYRGTRRGEWSAARPGRTLPPGKKRYPFYRRLGGPQGRYGRAEDLVPTGIRSRTVQPVVSRYTVWATRPTLSFIYLQQITNKCTIYLILHFYLKSSYMFRCLNGSSSGSSSVIPKLHTN